MHEMALHETALYLRLTLAQARARNPKTLSGLGGGMDSIAEKTMYFMVPPAGYLDAAGNSVRSGGVRGVGQAAGRSAFC